MIQHTETNYQLMEPLQSEESRKFNLMATLEYKLPHWLTYTMYSIVLMVIE